MDGMRTLRGAGWVAQLGCVGISCTMTLLARPLLAFGTRVQAKNREWKRRDDSPGTADPVSLCGPFDRWQPVYLIICAPAASSPPDKPRYKHGGGSL